MKEPIKNPTRTAVNKDTRLFLRYIINKWKIKTLPTLNAKPIGAVPKKKKKTQKQSIKKAHNKSNISWAI